MHKFPRMIVISKSIKNPDQARLIGYLIKTINRSNVLRQLAGHMFLKLIPNIDLTVPTTCLITFHLTTLWPRPNEHVTSIRQVTSALPFINLKLYSIVSWETGRNRSKIIECRITQRDEDRNTITRLIRIVSMSTSVIYITTFSQDRVSVKAFNFVQSVLTFWKSNRIYMIITRNASFTTFLYVAFDKQFSL